MSHSKPNWSPIWLTCVLVGLTAGHTLAKEVPAVPQQVKLSPDLSTQQLSISWLGGAVATFDLLILRTEVNETVFYETVSASVNQESGRHQWVWTSVEPLECTSLSVQIRSRDGQTTSDWSSTEVLQGRDLPSNGKTSMFPQDPVVPVGSNTTFCCILEEGKQLDKIIYNYSVMHPTRLSRRTYSITAVNQAPSSSAGVNVICYDKPGKNMAGTVVFVGYPPLPSDFVCETHDLTSAVCRWKEGPDTILVGKRKTLYTLNNRRCDGSSTQNKFVECSDPLWEGNWTLVAKNPLGQYILTDAAELSRRVHPTAPENLNSVVSSWNATVRWGWRYNSYSSLALVCQTELTPKDNPAKRSQQTSSGLDLRSMTLLDLYPDEEYSVRVRCGAQHNFWKWGNWSETISFRTNTYAPEAPDVWVWMNKDDTAQVIWKLLTPRQSRGPITAYEVTLWSPEENLQRTASIPPDTSAYLINLTQITTLGSDKITATVVARNTGGMSQPASVRIPLRLTDVEPSSVPRLVYTNGGFPLSWQRDDCATCAYVVEWYNASQNCPVGWIKLPAGTTTVSVESADFRPGVMYIISLYSSTSEAPELLQRWQGYIQELVPSSSVALSTTQQDSDILLAWGEIPLVNRRGFLLGYNIYIYNGSQLTLLANLTDPESKNYTVKGLSEGSYKFTVKAYNSAGEDTGATASILLEPYADWLILEIFASLGITSAFLLIATIFCYKKRKWVKKAFYPDIPEPKLPGDWSRAQGPLDVKPSPHSLVHMVDRPEWDSSKEALVVIPEEEEDEDRLGDDTDEPASLRYYHHVVDERPIRPRFPDSSASSASSASSLESARTDVTYTGIQTSGSSLVFHPDAESSSEVPQPLVHPSFCRGEGGGGGGGGGGGYRPQMQSRAQNDDTGLASPEPAFEPQAASAGGYKPQSSWHFDSPVGGGESAALAPSLGSPTSIASTQFLLPDGEEHADERRQPAAAAAAAWFTNLLSSTKP